MTGASPAAVSQAKRVQENGIPELQEAVETCAIAVSEAADIAALPPEQQYSTYRSIHRLTYSPCSPPTNWRNSPLTLPKTA